MRIAVGGGAMPCLSAPETDITIKTKTISISVPRLDFNYYGQQG